jgi:hypothetical protein
MGKVGMRQTDAEILDMMIDEGSAERGKKAEDRAARST